jgi:hypothetical protein
MWPPNARWEESGDEDEDEDAYTDTQRLLGQATPSAHVHRDVKQGPLRFGAGSGGTLETGDAAECVACMCCVMPAGARRRCRVRCKHVLRYACGG